MILCTKGRGESSEFFSSLRVCIELGGISSSDPGSQTFSRVWRYQRGLGGYTRGFAIVVIFLNMALSTEGRGGAVLAGFQ